jgi:hypothetical protein
VGTWETIWGTPFDRELEGGGGESCFVETEDWRCTIESMENQ